MQLQTDAQGLPINGSMIPQGDDARLLVMFRKEPVQNNFRSEQEGRPVFDEVDYIKILTPGSILSVVDRPVKEEDKQRFARSWLAFSTGDQRQVGGTPVDQWARLSVSQIAEAKALNVFSVEALATMSDANIAGMGMGWAGLREEARGYLKKSKDAATAQHQAAEISRLEDRIKEKDGTIADLVKRLEVLEAKAA